MCPARGGEPLGGEPISLHHDPTQQHIRRPSTSLSGHSTERREATQTNQDSDHGAQMPDNSPSIRLARYPLDVHRESLLPAGSYVSATKQNESRGMQ